MHSNHKQWISHIARAGYGAKAVVYILLGIFVVTTAFSYFRSDAPSQDDVFKSLLQQPFGSVLLSAVAAGLFCYALWRWIQAALNTEDLDMSKPKDAMMRGFYVLSGLLYTFAAWAATRTLIGLYHDDSKDGSKQVSEELLNYTWGQYLLAALGLAVLCFAFIQFKHGIKADYMYKFNLHHMSEAQTHICRNVGRLGYLARGVVYTLVSVFFVQAAIEIDPSEAGGLKTAFATILDQRYGQYELAAIGVGIAMFGVFCAFETVYRTTPGNR